VRETVPVHPHNDGPTEANVVLERHLAVGDLARAAHATQLPAQLRTLRKACGAQRMALRDQPATGVHNPLAAVCHHAAVNELCSLADWAKAKRLITKKLVCRKTVVELDHLAVLGRQTSLLVHQVRSAAGHVEADHRNATVLEGGCSVRAHRHGKDLHSLALQVVALHELLGAQHGSGPAFAGRAALQLGERGVDLGGAQDLLKGVLVTELGVGVVHRVLVVLVRDLGKVLRLGAKLLHVLSAGISKHLRSEGRSGDAARLHHHLDMLVKRVGPVGKLGSKGATVHLLKSNSHSTLRRPALNQLLGNVQGSGACRAVVVHVVHWDARQANRINGALPAGGIPVHIARHSVVDRLEGDVGIMECPPQGDGTHLRVVPVLLSWLFKLCHPDAHHKNSSLRHLVL